MHSFSCRGDSTECHLVLSKCGFSLSKTSPKIGLVQAVTFQLKNVPLSLLISHRHLLTGQFPRRVHSHAYFESWKYHYLPVSFPSICICRLPNRSIMTAEPLVRRCQPRNYWEQHGSFFLSFAFWLVRRRMQLGVIVNFRIAYIIDSKIEILIIFPFFYY